jgi:pimeloyl-ACP methyl ester carboxylesterase
MWTAGPVGELWFEDGGKGDPAFLFVHGLAGESGHWSAQLERFRPDRRAAAFDLRAHGRSDPDPRDRYTAEDFAGDVASVIERLGLGRFVLVVHSFAGHIAGIVAERHADRLAGLVLVDPMDDFRAMPDRQAQRFIHDLGLETYRKTLRERFDGLLEGARPTTRGRVLRGLRALPREVAAVFYREALEHDPVTPLRRSEAPKLAVVSEARAADPYAIHRLVPDLPTRVVRGTSHWIMLDDPEELNRILAEFVEGLR